MSHPPQPPNPYSSQQPPNPYSAPQQQGSEPGGYVGPGGQLPPQYPAHQPVGSPLAKGGHRRPVLAFGVAGAAVAIIVVAALLAVVLLRG